jgi:HAD superfamily hydrolase (TIGR01509 family)
VPGLVFDFDGLMIDSERVIAEAIIEVVAGHGAELSIDDIAHLFGTVDADEAWEALLLERLGRPLSMAELDGQADLVIPGRVDALGLLPGVAELLGAAAAAGWQLAVATGSSRDRIERRLDRLGVLDQFDVVVSRSDVERGKPFPDVFLEAARRLALPPSDCIVLEDSLPGVEAAVAAGMPVVLCPSIVTAGCAFPPVARRVASIGELSVDELARLLW